MLVVASPSLEESKMTPAGIRLVSDYSDNLA